MQFHNAEVDRSRAVEEDNDDDALSAKARQSTMAHWQASALTEVLPTFVKTDMIDDVLKNGPKFYGAEMARSRPLHL